jgi:hypothetical protein
MKGHNKSFPQIRIWISSITGTTAMTLFSYLVSGKQHRNFREPDLLDKLFHRLPLFKTQKNTGLTGWLLHYLAGLLFAEGYAGFWLGNRQTDIKTGMVLGGLSGFAAILIWKFSYALHPNPPSIDFVSFSRQLIIAHVLFGVFVALGYDIAQPPRPTTKGSFLTKWRIVRFQT